MSTATRIPVFVFCRECGEVPVEVRPWDLEPRICGHCAADRVRAIHARMAPGWVAFLRKFGPAFVVGGLAWWVLGTLLIKMVEAIGE